MHSWVNLTLCPAISKDKEYEIALIDSDVLRYELGAITTNHAFVKGYRIPAASEFIHKRCEEKIARINSSTGGVKFMCIFSGTGNFRFDVASTQKYKGNRDGFEKPEHWSTVNDYLKENYPNAVVNDREADDYLAERQRRSGNTIICTRDKDLLVTPGWHYRWSCGENQPEVPPHFVSEWEAWFNFFVQCLIGDTTDNILGCGERRPTSRAGKKVLWRFGVGKKSARALLENCHNQYAMYQTVRMEYYKLFGEDWEWKLLENARLLFVGQRADDLFDWSWLNKEWK